MGTASRARARGRSRAARRGPVRHSGRGRWSTTTTTGRFSPPPPRPLSDSLPPPGHWHCVQQEAPRSQRSGTAGDGRSTARALPRWGDARRSGHVLFTGHTTRHGGEVLGVVPTDRNVLAQSPRLVRDGRAAGRAFRQERVAPGERFRMARFFWMWDGGFGLNVERRLVTTRVGAR
ncbi:hypothetical protein BC628DRAFT_1391419 [Trametes gibbosa]|nr:hypothetical protein BC628DRAFT_1391419 [Trametes gibbosa]